MLLAGEQEERIIDDMRFSPFGTYICGVWDGDTVRLFSAVDGSVQYGYAYTGSGRICHIVMPRENKLILHIKLSEELLRQCKSIQIAGQYVYVIDENGMFHEWNLETDTVLENVLPTVGRLLKSS